MREFDKKSQILSPFSSRQKNFINFDIHNCDDDNFVVMRKAARLFVFIALCSSLGFRRLRLGVYVVDSPGRIKINLCNELNRQINRQLRRLLT